jgi:hypothetical protein
VVRPPVLDDVKRPHPEDHTGFQLRIVRDQIADNVGANDLFVHHVGFDVLAVERDARLRSACCSSFTVIPSPTGEAAAPARPSTTRSLNSGNPRANSRHRLVLHPKALRARAMAGIGPPPKQDGECPKRGVRRANSSLATAPRHPHVSDLGTEVPPLLGADLLATVTKSPSGRRLAAQLWSRYVT